MSRLIGETIGKYCVIKENMSIIIIYKKQFTLLLKSNLI